MKNSTAYLILFLALGLAFSCKKEEENKISPGLYGLDVEEEPVPFVAPGTTVTVQAVTSGLYTSDGSTPEEAIGLYWTVDGSGVRDTLTLDISASNPAYSYTPEETGSVTIYCYAFSSGYSNGSVSVSFRAIDPENSLSGLEGETAQIGGNKYYVTTLDGTTWMGNNLYGTDSGISFYLASVTDSFLGRFYTWEEAVSACPEGWKLPSAEQWDALGADAGALMADATVLEEQMWTYWPGMEITNAKKFNAIPAGYVDRSGGDDNVQGYMDYAIFWTATPAGEDGSLAQFRYIYADQPEVQAGTGGKTSLALSVRCIREK